MEFGSGLWPSDQLGKLEVGVAVYFVVTVVFGSLFYGDTDIEAFLSAAQATIGHTEIYALPQSAYPPLPYWIFRAVLEPANALGFDIDVPNYPAVFSLKLLFIGALVTTVYLPRNINRTRWAAIVLLNPLTLALVVLFGQSDSLAALGVVGALVSVHRERWTLAGAAVAFAASIKIFPVLMAGPLMWRYRENWKQIVFGALPVAALTGGMILGAAPHSGRAFLDTTHPFGLHSPPITTASFQSLFTHVMAPETVNALPIFPFAVLAFTAIGMFGSFRVDAFALICPLFAPVLFYAYTPMYRWISVVFGIAYLWLYHDDVGRRTWKWTAALLAFVSIRPLEMFLFPWVRVPNLVVEQTIRPYPESALNVFRKSPVLDLLPIVLTICVFGLILSVTHLKLSDRHWTVPLESTLGRLNR